MSSRSVTDVLRGLKVFDLGMELYHGMPHHPLQAPFMYQMMRTHGDYPFSEGAATAAMDMFVMGCHTGTHLDGLGHFANDLCLHGGLPAAQEHSKTEGLKSHGIEQVALSPRRGILLDVAATLGVRVLDPHHIIGPAELEAAAKAAKVDVRPGDVVLIRTGWITLWPDARRYYGLQSGQPGINIDGARWITDQGAFCIGSDNFSVEHAPTPGDSHPVHVHCLVDKGVYLLEVLNLEELAQARIPEFVLIIIPLKIRGATGSPVRPLALV